MAKLVFRWSLISGSALLAAAFLASVAVAGYAVVAIRPRRDLAVSPSEFMGAMFPSIGLCTLVGLIGLAMASVFWLVRLQQRSSGGCAPVSLKTMKLSLLAASLGPAALCAAGLTTWAWLVFGSPVR